MSPKAELRDARKALGLTQHGLAEALQMGKHGWQSISKWESDNNEHDPPGPVMVAVRLMRYYVATAPSGSVSAAKTGGVR